MGGGLIAKLVIILIHSPLTGHLTWSLVAEKLRNRGFQVLLPNLREEIEDTPPYWKQHVAVVAHTVQSIAPGQTFILVAHSGAGVLLPAIRETMNLPIAAYIFVDAIIPEDGKSRLDLFEPNEAAKEFRASAVDGFLPTWSEEDLLEVIPDAELRRRFVAELRPLPLTVYEEPIPVFAGWPDAPCAYLKLSSIYQSQAGQARRAGWPVLELEALHFHMLVDPAAVTGALLELLTKMDVPRTESKE